MDNLVRRYWNWIRSQILGTWGDQVSHTVLERPMSYDDLCKFLHEECSLQHREATREVNRMLDRVRYTPPGA